MYFKGAAQGLTHIFTGKYLLDITLAIMGTWFAHGFDSQPVQRYETF